MAGRARRRRGLRLRVVSLGRGRVPCRRRPRRGGPARQRARVVGDGPRDARIAFRVLGSGRAARGRGHPRRGRRGAQSRRQRLGRFDGARRARAARRRPVRVGHLGDAPSRTPVERRGRVPPGRARHARPRAGHRSRSPGAGIDPERGRPRIRPQPVQEGRGREHGHLRARVPGRRGSDRRDRGVHRHVRARSRPRLPEQLRHLACASVPARRGPGPGEAIRRSARAPGRKAARARRNRADGARPVTSSLGPHRRRARSREDGARPRRPRPARRRRHPLRDDRRATECGCGMGRRARGPREDPRRRAAQGARRVALARAPGGALRRSALPKPSGSPRRAPSAHRGRDDQGRRGGHALGGRAPERGSAARHERVRDRPRAAARRCRDDRRRTACPGARHARRDDRGRNARGVVRARTALHAGSRARRETCSGS